MSRMAALLAAAAVFGLFALALQEFRAGSLLGALLRLVRRRHPAHEAGGLLAEPLLRAFGRR